MTKLQPNSESMGVPNSDLHGSAPDSCSIAVLLVDVINPLDFPEADELLVHALPMAERISELKRRAKQAKIPVIYANDNFGRWRSDLRAVVDRCREPGSKGRELVEMLLPAEEDYFVLKPKHSAFYSTTLDTLLRYLGTRTLVIAGLAGNICVLFTANEAYMRDYELLIPRDCVASNSQAENEAALAQMAKVLKADTRPIDQLELPVNSHRAAASRIPKTDSARQPG